MEPPDSAQFESFIIRAVLLIFLLSGAVRALKPELRFLMRIFWPRNSHKKGDTHART